MQLMHQEFWIMCLCAFSYGGGCKRINMNYLQISRLQHKLLASFHQPLYQQNLAIRNLRESIFFSLFTSFICFPITMTTNRIKELQTNHTHFPIRNLLTNDWVGQEGGIIIPTSFTKTFVFIRRRMG